MAMAEAPDILGEAAGQMTAQGSKANYFQNLASDQYGGILATPSSGGYTPEEAAAIQQTQANQDLATGAQYSPYLSADEQKGITGDPNAAFQYYNPSAIMAPTQQGQQAQQAAIQAGQSGMQGAQSQAETWMPQTLAAGTQALAQNQAQTGAGYASAIDPSKLGLSGQFNQNYQMTPEQQQALVTAAGMSVGQQYKSAQDAIQRQAAAAGQGAPGMAVAQERLAQQSAAASGDALTQARIAASQEAANRQLTSEQLRLGAESNIAGMKTSAVQSQGQQAQAAALAQEQAGLGAQQYITTMGQQNAQNTQAASLNAAQNTQAAQEGAQQYVQGTGMAQANTSENAAQQRAQTIAQSNLAGNQTQYGRGLTQAQTASQTAQTVANQQQAQQQEARSYLTGQAAQSDTQYNAAADRQVNAVGTTGQVANQAAQGAGNYQVAQKGTPGTAERVFSTLVGGASQAAKAIPTARGGVFTQPSDVLIGEEGPEAVVPLNADSSKYDVTRKNYGPGSYLSAAGRGGLRGGLGGAVGGMIGNYLRSRRSNQDVEGAPEGADQSAYESAMGAGNYAQGGIVTRPTRAIIGEKGPEAVVPLTQRSDAVTTPQSVGQGITPSQPSKPGLTVGKLWSTAPPVPTSPAQGTGTQPTSSIQPSKPGITAGAMWQPPSYAASAPAQQASPQPQAPTPNQGIQQGQRSTYTPGAFSSTASQSLNTPPSQMPRQQLQTRPQVRKPQAYSYAS